MKIFQSLKTVTNLLKPFDGSWAVCGGIAACVYRDVPRFTGDIDIALGCTSSANPIDIANSILSSLGYVPMVGFVTDQTGRLIQQQALVIGREKEPGTYLGVDFLLPVLPWVQGAVSRAQENRLDYGFDRLPTVTLEDLCLAKLYALQGTPERHTDRDDIESILRAAARFDLGYFRAGLQSLKLSLPIDLEKLVAKYHRTAPDVVR